MSPNQSLKILHLTTHLNIGGISSYILRVGSRMIANGDNLAVLSSGGELEELFRQNGFQVYQFSIRVKSELHPKLYWALPKILRLVRKEKFELIHAHTRVTQVLAFFIKLFTGTPFVTTAHGFYKNRLGRKYFKCWGSRVIAISPLVAEELAKTHGVAFSSIRTVLNGMDVEGFSKKIQNNDSEKIRMEYGIRQDAFVLGCVARLVEDKGHHYLIEAVHHLKKANPQIFLLIIGDGRQKKKLERQIRRRHLKDHVRILSSQQDLAKCYSIMDLFAHPATYREGFGLSILEAMAAKIPVIVTNIWAVNTIIRHGINGFMVEPKNSNALADMISFAMAHPEQALSVANNAYDMAKESYSIDRMVRELETVYTETLAEARKKETREAD